MRPSVNQKQNELYDFDAVVRHETGDAFLLDVGKESNIWLPKSLTQDNGDGTFTVPRWFAEKKEIV